MIHSRTKLIAAIALLMCMVSGAVFGGMIWIISSHKSDVYAARVASKKFEIESRALGELQDTMREEEGRWRELRGFILEDAGVITFLQLTEDLAREQGVTLTTELNLAPIDDTFETLHMSTVVEGSFDGVMQMIRLLENLPYQSQVEQVSLSRVGGEGMWSASLSITVLKYTAL